MTAGTMITSADSSHSAVRRSRSTPLSRYALLAIFAIIVAVISVTVPNFATWANIANVLQRNSIIGIVACGMLLMIVQGGFDLSVGAVGAMASVLAATLIVDVSTPAGIAAALCSDSPSD
jgi:ribose transport system permease protein/putative xylitol transport system permease protein